MARPLGFMYALGLNGLPHEIVVRGQRYMLEREQKHDFWAATGFYRRDDDAAQAGPVLHCDQTPASECSEGPDPQLQHPPKLPSPQRVVAKFNRQVSFLGFPLRWIGRWLRMRERRAYARLQGVPGIPDLLGDVGDTGFVHAYVDGSPLSSRLPLGDDFFPKLITLFDIVHARGIAYVDTNKPQNILLGDDGLPYLIDFQISFDQHAWWPAWLGRKLMVVFSSADIYHVMKQKLRYRPDLLTDAERERVRKPGFFIGLHRSIRWPYFQLRRPTMRWLEQSGRAEKRGSD